MGTHTSGILIKGGKRPPLGELLEAMVLPTLPSEKELSISRALELGSNDGIAVAEVKDSRILIGATMFMPIKDRSGKSIPMGDGLWNREIEACLFALSQFGSFVAGFILEDASATYGFDTYKNRERTRLYGARVHNNRADAGTNRCADWCLSPMTLCLTENVSG